MADKERNFTKRITMSDKDMKGVAGGDGEPQEYWCGDICPRCGQVELQWKQLMESVICPNCGWENGMPLSSH